MFYVKTFCFQRYIDDVTRMYTWTPINDTDYRYASIASTVLIIYLHIYLLITYMPPPTVWVWYCLRTVNTTSRLIWVMSCSSCSVSAQLIHTLFSVRLELILNNLSGFALRFTVFAAQLFRVGRSRVSRSQVHYMRIYIS